MTKPMYNKTDGEGVCKGGERGEREIFKSDGGINPPTKIHQFVWHALFFFLFMFIRPSRRRELL